MELCANTVSLCENFNLNYIIDCTLDSSNSPEEILYANIESSKTVTFTYFLNAGFDATECYLAAASQWTVKGPATNDAYVSITDASVSSWLSISNLNLIVTIANSDQVDFDGRYTLKHEKGHASETKTLVICHMKAPQTKYAWGL